MDGLPRPILQRRNREGALGAIFLGNVEAFQRSWAVATPLTNAVDGSGFLLWRIPEFVINPGVFLPVFSVTRLTARARGKRVHQQIAQALDLAPSPACTAWTIRRCRDRTDGDTLPS